MYVRLESFFSCKSEVPWSGWQSDSLGRAQEIQQVCVSITTPGFVVLSRNWDRKQEIHDVFGWGFNNIFISTRVRDEFALNRLASATDPSLPMIKRFLKA